MIVGVGIDILEPHRIAAELLHGPWQQNDGVYTAAEVEYCQGARRPELRYAACFAAKEAMLKALGRDVADLRMFREVEVRLDRGSCDAIVVRDRLQKVAEALGARRTHLSFAVGKRNAAAMVILES